MRNADQLNPLQRFGRAPPPFPPGLYRHRSRFQHSWMPLPAKVLGISMPSRGKIAGRPLDEALRNGPAIPTVRRQRLMSETASNGFATALEVQTLNRWR